MMRVLTLFLALILANFSLAGYSGPEVSDFTKVKDVLEKGIDDMSIKIEGHLVKRLAHDRFLFQDETGQIDVELRARLLPYNENVNDKTKVLIRGTVNKKRAHTEIEVRSLEVVR